MPTYVCANYVPGLVTITDQVILSKYNGSSLSDVTQNSSGWVLPGTTDYSTGGANVAASDTPAGGTPKIPIPEVWAAGVMSYYWNTSGIPTNETITNVNLEYKMKNTDFTSQTVEVHGIVNGVVGTGIGSWTLQAANNIHPSYQSPSSYNNLLFSFSANSTTYVTGSAVGTAAARSWINKGGYTAALAAHYDYVHLTSGWQDRSAIIDIYNKSSLIVTTTAAVPFSYNLIVSPR
jgi:hypothetical protein